MELGIGSILFIFACVWWICKTIEQAARPKEPLTEREQQAQALAIRVAERRAMTDDEYQMEIDMHALDILEEARREAKRREHDPDHPSQHPTSS